MTEPASPLAGANVRVLTQRLCEVEAVIDVVGRLGAQLRAELLARGIARWREDGTAPTFRAPGLGSVSLSVPQQKVTVDVADAFASWVAQKHPEAATARAVIAVPPDRLEALLDVLRPVVDGIDGAKLTGDVEVSPAFTKRLLDSEVVIADSGGDRAVIDKATGEVVDGVKVHPGADPGNPDAPLPRSVSVRLEPQAKADAAAQAAARLGTVLEHGLSDALAGDVTEIAAGNPAMPSMVDVHDLEAEGEPDEEPVDLDRCGRDGCGHPRAEHNGRTHAGKCLVPASPVGAVDAAAAVAVERSGELCGCSRFVIPSIAAVAW